MVEALGLVDIVVDNLDIDTAVLSSGQILEQLAQLGTSNTIGAVNSQVTLGLCVLEGLLESEGQLLVVPLLADFTILLLSTLCVDTADQVVQLRGCQELVVGELGLCGSQAVGQTLDQAGSRSACVAGEDDSGGGFEVDLEGFGQVVVYLDHGFVVLGVGELGSVLLP